MTRLRASIAPRLAGPGSHRHGDKTRPGLLAPVAPAEFTVTGIVQHSGSAGAPSRPPPLSSRLGLCSERRAGGPPAELGLGTRNRPDSDLDSPADQVMSLSGARSLAGTGTHVTEAGSG